MDEQKYDLDTRAKSLSPMEFFYYNLYLKNPDSKALMISKEVHFHGLELLPEEVVELFKLILALHPIGHTGFETFKEKDTNDTLVGRKILDIKDALDCHVILNLKDTAMFQTSPMRAFDLKTRAPVKFAFSVEPYLVVRFIFHRIGFDYKAVEIFVRNFISIMKRLGLKKEVPQFNCLHSRQSFYDLDRYLTSNFAPLSQFWSKKMKKGITKASFADITIKPILKKSGEKFYYSYLSFTKFTSGKIMDMAAQKNISLIGLIISVYQLMLSFHSKTKYVTILTETDLRKKITGADNLVESMTNLVPLTAKIPTKNDETLEKFAMDNESQIQECMSMSAFPFSGICDILKKSDRKNVMRHKVVQRIPEVKSDKVISEGKIRDVGMLHETSLECLFDKHRTILYLQLQASTDTYSQTDANAILENLAKVLRLISCRPDISIDQLRNHILQNKEFIDLFDFFIKVGENGRRDEVLISLTEDEDQNHSVLKWSKSGKKEVNSIDLKTISNVHFITDTNSDAKELWMKRKDDVEYRFIFMNDDHIDDWIERLELILNFQILCV